jgi:DNA polymerase III subunit delta'
MNWKNVYGRQQIVTALRAALAQARVAHAYLFCGPEGIGKKTLAQALAEALVCENGEDGACGSCRACRQASGLGHPDIHHIIPDGKSLKVAQIRELKKEAYLRPREARYQVFILENAELMTADAAGSLLKVLEEPPPATVFILLTDNPAGLLPTVISRCQLFQLPRLDIANIQDVLREAGFSGRPDFNDIAAAAEGIPGRALSLATETGGSRYGEAVLFLEDVRRGENVVVLADRLAGHDCIGIFVETLLTVLRDLMVMKATKEERLMSLAGEWTLLEGLMAEWPATGDCAALEIILKLQKDVKNPVNVRLALERALRRLKEAVLNADSSGNPF